VKPKQPVKPISVKPVKAEVRPRIRYKSYVVTEAGFHCRSCGFETITFDETTPARCGKCGTSKPTMVWKNKITTEMKVETLVLS
jgi:predicted Zn-ribbon and HTH transcriptional regulator